MTGLFGDNDGNSTNDFKTNDNVLVSENASQSSIHHDFGSSCKENIFYFNNIYIYIYNTKYYYNNKFL